MSPRGNELQIYTLQPDRAAFLIPFRQQMSIGLTAVCSPAQAVAKDNKQQKGEFMKRVLMVCLGNICRSPLAQGILEAKAASQHLAVEVDSAGTSHWHTGEKPDPRSVYTAAQHGLDISGQRARQFTANDFRSYDLILAMDQSNYDDILRLAPDETAQKKVKKIMDFVPGAQAGSNVPDPYWDDDGFEKVYGMLDQACEGIIQSIRGEA